MREDLVDQLSFWRKLLLLVIATGSILNWIEWLILIRQHWPVLSSHSHISALLLLVMYPIPLWLMLRSRQLYTALQALVSYLLLFYAIGIVFH